MSAPAKTREVFDILSERAREMRTVSYKELAEATDLTAAGVGTQLRYIRDEICRNRGLPWLNAIAVNSDSRFPGDRFLPDDHEWGDSEERLWRGMVLQVFAYDWRDINFPESSS